MSLYSVESVVIFSRKWLIVTEKRVEFMRENSVVFKKQGESTKEKVKRRLNITKKRVELNRQVTVGT